MESAFPVSASYKIALEVGTSYKGCTDLIGKLEKPTLDGGVVNNSSRFSDHFGLQCFHRGQVNQYFDTFGDLNGLIKKTKEDLEAFGKIKNVKVINSNEMYDICYRAAAILCLEINDELLHLLIWIPVQIFTIVSLNAATEAWSWLLACNAKISTKFLSEMVELWETTTRRYKGIFSPKSCAPKALLNVTYGPTKPFKEIDEMFNNLYPHYIWVKFICDNYYVLSSHIDNISCYFRIIVSSLYRKCVNCFHPISKLCYLKLFILNWKILHSSAFSNSILLRQGYKLMAYESLLKIFTHG